VGSVESPKQDRRGRLFVALAAGAAIAVSGLAFVAPAFGDIPIGPNPAPSGTVSFTAAPATGLVDGQQVTFSVQTSGGTTLIGTITAHICRTGLSNYGLSNFGYSDASASRCVWAGDITTGALDDGAGGAADYEKVYPAYSGAETNSGPLTFKVGTGSVTWGNALGYGPFTLQADATHKADLVVQVNLSGDTVPTTYFIQPLTFAGLPGAPTAVKALSANAAAAVSWTAPADHGVSPVTGYTVTPYLGAVPQTPRVFNATALTETVTGLTNAKVYTFKVAATNSAGTGPQSAASAAVVVGTPRAPAGVVARPMPTTAVTGPIAVGFVAPANAGAAITKYTATCTSTNGGVTRSAVRLAATAGTIVVGAASTARAYTCKVSATNSRGTSPASLPSLPITVGAPAQVARPATTRLSSGVLRVAFTNLTASQADGKPLSLPQYTATCVSSNGGVARAAVRAATPINVGALTPGKTYTCMVRAHNPRGYSLASAPSVGRVA
jgi:hypothetical protein